MSLQNNEDVNDSTVFDRLDNPRIGPINLKKVSF